MEHQWRNMEDHNGKWSPIGPGDTEITGVLHSPPKCNVLPSMEASIEVCHAVAKLLAGAGRSGVLAFGSTKEPSSKLPKISLQLPGSPQKSLAQGVPLSSNDFCTLTLHTRRPRQMPRPARCGTRWPFGSARC